MQNTFDVQTLANDISEVRRVYANFFNGLSAADWDKPVKGGPREWTLHETVAHLCALSGAGLESIEQTLAGKTYVFEGLDDRFHFVAYNRSGIDAHLALPMRALCDEFLEILDRAAAIASQLDGPQAELTSEMPIYNRPVKVVEALSILMFHAGLHHSAQVAEPAGVPPLWQQLSPEVRHRVIGRVMRALSLLYRYDLGKGLKAVIVFQVDGPGGGSWHIDITPQGVTSDEGPVSSPSLVVHLREAAIFCHMFTGRFNLLVALATGRMKLSGDLRLFPRMSSLFSVDARA